MSPYLGLPLSVALARAAQDGLSPEIRRLEPPRGAREMGTERVVRTESEGRIWLVARFLDDARDGGTNA